MTLATHNSNGRPADFTTHDDDEATAIAGIRAILRLVGDDPDRPGVEDTPARVIKAYRELCSAPEDPARLLARTFTIDDHDVDSMIAVGPIEFVSVCEHHLLPFTGHAWVAYIPTDVVVGLSKLPRLVQHYAKRPQIQERLTKQITNAIDKHLNTQGAACVIRSTHSCMSLRGIRAVGAEMVTSSLTGAIKTNPAARAEFMALTNGAHPTPR